MKESNRNWSGESTSHSDPTLNERIPVNERKTQKARLTKEVIKEMKILEKGVNEAGGKFKVHTPDYSPAKPFDKLVLKKQKKRVFYKK